jgi:hypothetical protein
MSIDNVLCCICGCYASLLASLGSESCLFKHWGQSSRALAILTAHLPVAVNVLHLGSRRLACTAISSPFEEPLSDGLHRPGRRSADLNFQRSREPSQLTGTHCCMLTGAGSPFGHPAAGRQKLTPLRRVDFAQASQAPPWRALVACTALACCLVGSVHLKWPSSSKGAPGPLVHYITAPVSPLFSTSAASKSGSRKQVGLLFSSVGTWSPLHAASSSAQQHQLPDSTLTI